MTQQDVTKYYHLKFYWWNKSLVVEVSYQVTLSKFLLYMYAF